MPTSKTSVVASFTAGYLLTVAGLVSKQKAIKSFVRWCCNADVFSCSRNFYLHFFNRIKATKKLSGKPRHVQILMFFLQLKVLPALFELNRVKAQLKLFPYRWFFWGSLLTEEFHVRSLFLTYQCCWCVPCDTYQSLFWVCKMNQLSSELWYPSQWQLLL